MEKVCDELDNVLLRINDTLRTLNEEHNKLETLMKTGFLQLSRARYNMGIKSVGIHQFHENEMTPLYRTIVTSSADDKDIEDDKFTVYRCTEDEDDDSDITDSSSSVRKRQVKFSEENTKDGVPSIEMSKLKIRNDPLKCFGLLVPQNLRTSQSSFQKAIETSGHIASMKCKLTSLIDKYSDLLKQKKKFGDED